MTTNPEESEKPPLTPTNDGKVQFLGPDTVRYISPPRIEVVRQPVRPPAPPPPPSYQSAVYPQMMNPQMMMPMPMMMQPQMVTYIPQMMPSPPVMLSPPTQPSTSPSTASAVTLNINTSPQSVTSGTGTSIGGAAGGGALICPKCRKGIVTRQQDRFRKKLLMFCGIFCCPLTCGLPLCCLCCNYVDACACCGMNYGHRGRKAHKKKVNAVKI